jgi:hypothetical protein
MKVRSGWIESGLDAKRYARSARPFQLGAKLRLTNDLGGAFLDVGQLFINWGKAGHLGIIRNAEARSQNAE